MAHRSLAFSCLYYLNSRVDLVSRSGLDSHVLEHRILDSLNGLDHYSYQFWIDHVLGCLKDTSNATESSKLIDELDELSSLWLQGRPHVPEVKQCQSTEDLLSLSTHPAALNLMRQVLAFRRRLGRFERDGNGGEGKIPITSHHG